MSKANKEKRVVNKVSKESSTRQLTVEEKTVLKQADYQKRVELVNKIIDKALQDHDLAISVHLDYQRGGIQPKIALIDIKKYEERAEAKEVTA